MPNSIDRSTLVLQVEDVTPPEPVQDEAPEGAAQLEPGEVEEVRIGLSESVQRAVLSWGLARSEGPG